MAVLAAFITAVLALVAILRVPPNRCRLLLLLLLLQISYTKATETTEWCEVKRSLIITGHFLNDNLALQSKLA